jgi:hypothetical protein
MSKQKNREFRLRTKKFFLTYPQLPNIPNLVELALTSFETIFKMNRRDFKYLISVELHADGNPHLHVYLEFGLPQGIYSVNKLDLLIDEEIFHGNYQSVKSKHATIQYIIKSVENIEELTTNLVLPFYNNRYYSNINEHLYDILVNENYQSAIDALYLQYPKEAIQRGSAIIGNLELADVYHSIKRKLARPPKYTLDNFKEIPESLIEWLEEENPKTLILFGPSGTGKTGIAKALLHSKGFKYLFVRDINALKEFRPSLHDAIIFDDLDTEFLKKEGMIHLLDVEDESQVRILYKYMDIPENTRKIITTNNLYEYTKHGKVIQRRVTTVEIKEPQFLLSPTEESADSFPSSPKLDISGATATVDFVPTITKTEKKRGRPVGSKNKPRY